MVIYEKPSKKHLKWLKEIEGIKKKLAESSWRDYLQDNNLVPVNGRCYKKDELEGLSVKENSY